MYKSKLINYKIQYAVNNIQNKNFCKVCIGKVGELKILYKQHLLMLFQIVLHFFYLFSHVCKHQIFVRVSWYSE